MLESVLFPIVSKINEYLSNYILIFLLVGVGLWYSIKTRFVQVRCFGEGMKKFFGEMNLRGGAQKSGMTSFLRRHPHRRPRRHLLDVDHRLLRHGHHLCRGYPGPEDPYR